LKINIYSLLFSTRFAVVTTMMMVIILIIIIIIIFIKKVSEKQTDTNIIYYRPRLLVYVFIISFVDYARLTRPEIHG